MKPVILLEWVNGQIDVAEKTFLKYAKLVDNEEVVETNKIKFFANERPTLVEVPKITKAIE